MCSKAKLARLQTAYNRREMSEKSYSNGEITVIWKPEVCSHSTNCWRGLLPVFDPRKRPWVNMAGATTDRIKAQIEKCPSGALSYIEDQDTP